MGKRYRAGIAAGRNDVVFLHDLLGIGAQQRAEIVVVDAAGGVGIPAVEIDQRLEAVLFAAVEHPVDGALLVNLAMVCKEVLQEIIADDFTAGVALVAHERKVFFQRRCAEYFLDEVYNTVHKVIFAEIFLIAQGNDIISHRLETRVFTGIPFAAGIGKTGPIQRVAAKDAADCVGEQAADVAAQIGFAHGDVLILDFGGQFVLQAVDVDEDAVEFFLVGFEFCKAVIALALPEHIAQFHRAGDFGALTVVVVFHCGGNSSAIPQVM